MAAELIGLRRKATFLVVGIATGGVLLLTLISSFLTAQNEGMLRLVLRNYLFFGPFVPLVLGWAIYRALNPIVALAQHLQHGQMPTPEMLRQARLAALQIPRRFVYFPFAFVFLLTLGSDFLAALFDPLYRLSEHLPISGVVIMVALILTLLMYFSLRQLLLPVLLATMAIQDEVAAPRFTFGTRYLFTLVSLTSISILFISLIGYALLYQNALVILYNKYYLLLQTLNQYVFPYLQKDEDWIATVEEQQGLEGYAFLLNAEGELLTRIPHVYADLKVDWSLIKERDAYYVETPTWAAVSAPVYRSGEEPWRVGFVYRVNPFVYPLLRRVLGILGGFTLLMLLFVVLVNRLATQDLTRDLTYLTQRLLALSNDTEVDLQPLPLLSSDEVGDLVSAFNRFQERLKQQQAQMVRERKELLVLQSVSQRLNSTLDIMQILQEIITSVETNFGFYNTSILLLDENEQALYVAAGPNYLDPEVRKRPVPLGKGIVGYVAATGEVYLAQNVDASPHFIRTDPATRSELAIPLRIGERIIGVFNVESDRYHAFSEDDVRMLTALAHQAAVALHNAQLYRQTEAERQVATLLAELARMVNSTLDLEEVLNRGLEQLEQVLKFDSASILLLSPEGNLTIAACRGFEHPEKVLGVTFTPDESNLSHETVRSQRVVVVPDVQNHPAWGHGRHEVEGVKVIRSWIGVPLSVQGQGIGLLTVDNHEPNFYTPEDARKAALFAAQLATAVHNARLYRQMQEHARDLGVLLNAMARISGLLDVRQLLHEIVHFVHETFAYSVVALHLVDERSGELSYVAQSEESVIRPSLSLKINPEQSLVHRAAARREVQRQCCMEEDGTSGVRYAELAIPIFAGEQVLGVFHLVTAGTDFDANAERLLTALANQVAVALQSARLYERVQTQAARLSLLQQISQTITSILDPRVLIQKVVELVAKTFAYPHVGIFLLDPDAQELYIGYQVGYPLEVSRMRLPLAGTGITVAAARSGRAVVCNDVRQDERYVDGLPGIGSELAVPLIGRAGLIGVLNIETTHLNAFGADDVELFTALGQQITVALENAHLFANVSEQTRQLTHLADMLAQEKRKLDVTLRTLVDGLLVTAPDGTVLLANPAAEAILQRPLHELVGRPLGTNAAEKELQRLIDEAQHNPKATFATEVTFSDFRSFKATAAAAEDPRLGVVTLLRDITREKELDRLKTDFITMVSHEMRTPLTSVLGFARVIRKQLERDLVPHLPQENPQVREAIKRIGDNLDIIQNEARRLNQVATDVFDLAQLEGGRMMWNDQPLVVAHVLEAVSQELRPLSESKHLRVITRLQDGLPVLIADRERVRQVFFNLLSNAIKFSPPGEAIYISLEALKPNETWKGWSVPGSGALLVTVSDRGPGIAPELQGRLFKRFQQITSDALTDKPKGTGLGLAICHEIVSHYQGMIGVESKPGEGSTFFFTLPWSKKPGETTDRPRSLQTAAAPVVLMVGRLDAALEQVREDLQTQGYVVLHTESGSEGVTLARAQTPRLIVLHTALADLTASDVLQLLKSDAATLDVPILLLSAHEVELNRGRERGADLCLQLPVAGELLAQHARTLLRLYAGSYEMRSSPAETPLDGLMTYLSLRGFQTVSVYDASLAAGPGSGESLQAWLKTQLQTGADWRAVRLNHVSSTQEAIVLMRKKREQSGHELV